MNDLQKMIDQMEAAAKAGLPVAAAANGTVAPVAAPSAFSLSSLLLPAAMGALMWFGGGKDWKWTAGAVAAAFVLQKR